MSSIKSDKTTVGINGIEKMKSRGRGRGLMNKKDAPNTEASPMSSTSSSTVEVNDHPPGTGDSPNKREGKVRRTKAGFEPYQVKRKNPVPFSDTENVRTKSTSAGSSNSSEGGSPNKSKADHWKSNDNNRAQSESGRKAWPKKNYEDEKMPGNRGRRRQNKNSRRQSPSIATDNNLISNKEDDWDLEVSSTYKTVTNPQNISIQEREEKENSTLATVNYTQVNQIQETQEKKLSQEDKIRYHENIKRKTQGIAILECPCTCNLSGYPIDNCVGECKSREASPSLLPTKIVSNSNLNDSIDTKFLVASPVEMKGEISEHSVLDSDVESEAASETFTHDDESNVSIETTSVNKVITTDEINAMFVNNSKEHGEKKIITSSNSSSLDTEPYDFRAGLIDALQNEIDRPSSKSSLSRTSSSGESALSRKLSSGSDVIFVTIKTGVGNNKEDCEKKNSLDVVMIDDDVASKETTLKDAHKGKSRSQMSSILSILNENKTLSDRAVPKTKSDQKQKKSRKKERGKDESPTTKRDSRKRNSRKTSSKKSDTSSNEQNVTTSKGGVIVLPNSNYIDEKRRNDSSRDRETIHTQASKHVHFSADADKNMSYGKSTDKKQIINQYLSEINDKHYQLKKLLARGFQSVESVNVMLHASETIQQKYGELIIMYQDYAFRYDYESTLWKTAFHNIISQFREFLETKSVPAASLQEVGKQYWNFLQNGVQFLDSLTLQLQEGCGFELEEYLNDPIKMSSCTKQIKFALRSCHLLLIFIGDLERYIAQLQQENNFEKAQQCYRQAQILAPKNGKSYNQLAVVAVMTKHKLDAVYFYTRSLQASNPILTAKERLTAIFQEIKKKAVLHKRKQIEIDAPVNVQNTFAHCTGSVVQNAKHRKNSDHLRDEVWIFYRKKHMFKVMLTDCNEVIDLTPGNDQSKYQQENEQLGDILHDKLTLRKVNHGFIVHFLFAHCQLYTNVGLEEFTSVHEDTLSDLTTLLAYPKASSVKLDNLLKYMAINIFMIHYLMEKQEHGNVLAGTALDYAIIFGMDMFAVLCKHCTDLMHADMLNKSLVVQFLPAVRIWLMWLSQHAEVVAKSSVSTMLDLWTTVCELLNIIEDFKVDDLEPSGGDESVENVYLLEDLVLAGFKPLSSDLTYSALSKEQEEIGCFNLRISSIKNLISQVDEKGNLPFAFDESEKIYKPVHASEVSSSPVKMPKLLDDEGDVEISEDVVIEDEEEDFGDVSHVDQLIAQKAALTKQLEEQESQRQTALAVLEVHKSQGRHLSENSPTYLVADTNCYIDHLQYIVALLDSKDFTLVVPLIVINELDGLKAGSLYDEKKFHDHHKKVQDCARLSVDVLEDRFSETNSNIRAITSSGNEMSTIAFRSEELSIDRGTNDDVILSCCLKYCKEHITRTEDATSVVRRDVVLLTNDRNLRLKAHTRFVPTVDITTFMKMAKFI